ncbi:hypothetical protein [Leadbettera azotonutricia]|uniref:Uncharacterized protein n=1 Tax=Leadbettera azotonutricia (strain ATCC BAA-888 / DSM 13862 / ZAS-9) TaxID=545695 RepID=F5Y7E5_LEAAZ|nr:hypothetical protein [Leadbettera azotonutricia]AEF80602.1 hypothetical protein TREAZ_3487 [Leadbettera azotonutricia ZAS-9]
MREKILCLVAYLFSIPGIVIARIWGSKSKLCLHHARHSLELFFFIAFLFVAWYIVSYALMFIPYGGFPIAVALFGIVIAGILFSLALCVIGIVGAFTRKPVVFPFVSSFVGPLEPLFKLIGLSEG